MSASRHAEEDSEIPGGARITSLALFLADKNGPASAHEIRSAVAGYSIDDSDEAFERKFLRDRKKLKTCGFSLQTTPDKRYYLDSQKTLAAQIDLTPREAAALRCSALVALSNPSFYISSDLRYALNKISGALGNTERRSDLEPLSSGNTLCITLEDACKRRKVTRFSYADTHGNLTTRTVHPCNLFLLSGDWYLSAFDVDRDGQRSFRVSRMDEVMVNPKALQNPDFSPYDIPPDHFIKLPFQCGDDSFTATFYFSPEARWKAETITQGKGSLEECNGGLLWNVEACDILAAARWAIENSPGITLVAPTEGVAVIHRGLRRIIDGLGPGGLYGTT